MNLIPIDHSYAEEIFTTFDADVTKYMGPKPADDIIETQGFIDYSLKGLENGINLQLVITDKDTGEFYGCAGLHDINKNGRPIRASVR